MSSRSAGTVAASTIGVPTIAVVASVVAFETSFIHFVASMSSTTSTVPL
jgi:hypothetical protein